MWTKPHFTEKVQQKTIILTVINMHRNIFFSRYTRKIISSFL